LRQDVNEQSGTRLEYANALVDPGEGPLEVLVLLEGVLHGSSTVVLAEVKGRISKDAVYAVWLEGGEEVKAVGLI
jgi:hypothetical protein